MANQLGFAEQLEPEWSVSRIVSHQGPGSDAIFEIEWGSGDRTWLPYLDAQGLVALQDYFESLGISGVSKLKKETRYKADSNAVGSTETASAEGTINITLFVDK